MKVIKTKVSLPSVPYRALCNITKAQFYSLCQCDLDLSSIDLLLIHTNEYVLTNALTCQK